MAAVPGARAEWETDPLDLQAWPTYPSWDPGGWGAGKTPGQARTAEDLHSFPCPRFLTMAASCLLCPELGGVENRGPLLCGPSPDTPYGILEGARPGP